MTLVEKDILRQYFENEKQILLLKGVIEVGRKHLAIAWENLSDL